MKAVRGLNQKEKMDFINNMIERVKGRLQDYRSGKRIFLCEEFDEGFSKHMKLHYSVLKSPTEIAEVMTAIFPELADVIELAGNYLRQEFDDFDLGGGEPFDFVSPSHKRHNELRLELITTVKKWLEDSSLNWEAEVERITDSYIDIYYKEIEP